jgi:hypothetical protein
MQCGAEPLSGGVLEGIFAPGKSSSDGYDISGISNAMYLCLVRYIRFLCNVM